MTHQPTSGPHSGMYPTIQPRRKRRVFLWFFLAVQALFLLWIITGVNAAGEAPADCGTLSAQTCQDAHDVGVGLGVAAIIAFWAVVDIILGISYGIYRLARRPEAGR